MPAQRTRANDAGLSSQRFQEREDNPELTVDAVARRHSSNLKWDSDLKKKLERKKKNEFEENYIRKVATGHSLEQIVMLTTPSQTAKYQIDKIFPDSSSENRVICVPGIGSKSHFPPL